MFRRRRSLRCYGQGPTDCFGGGAACTAMVSVRVMDPLTCFGGRAACTAMVVVRVKDPQIVSAAAPQLALL